MMLNIDQLTRRIQMDFMDYAKEGDLINGDKIAHHHIFVDNGAKILAVAHLDTVLNWGDGVFHKGKYFSPDLDDRLGAHVILDALPKVLGKRAYDILLTDHEESGGSTARFFNAPRPYNWIFQFDRAGHDVVTYQYGDDFTRKAIQKLGLIHGHGTYTDIVELEDLEVKAFNWGVGYHRQHTQRCYMDFTETMFMLRKFMTFYNTYKNTIMMHEPMPVVDYGAYEGRTSAIYNPYYYATNETCRYCGMWGEHLNEQGLCKYCEGYVDA